MGVFKAINIGVKSPSEDEVDAEMLDSILDILFMEEEKLLSYIIKQSFVHEFNDQIKNLGHIDRNAVIDVKIKDRSLKVNIDENNNFTATNPILLSKKIVYIDNPYTIDVINAYPY